MLRYFILIWITILPLMAAWRSEPVDAPYNFDAWDYVTNRSNVIDSLEHMHVVYGSDGLFHRWFDGSSWQVEMIDTTHDAGKLPSVAIDNDDHLHVCYVNETGDLSYANNVSGSWSREKLSVQHDAFNLYNKPSCALDNNGKMHVVYGYLVATSNYHLQYASNSSGSWQVQTITDTASHGTPFAVAVDQLNIPHAVYVDTSDALQYATRSTSSWTNSLVESGCDVSGDSDELALAMDSANKAHLVYNNGNDGALSYMTDKLGSWAKITLADNAFYNRNPSIVIDSVDAIHISCKESNDNIAYMTNKTEEWLYEQVPDTPVFVSTSLAVDSNQKAHIAYWNSASTAQLAYTTNVSVAWSSMTLDIDTGYRWYPSFALSTAGHVFVSDYATDTGKIQFATNKSGTYTVEALEKTLYPSFSSIGVDSNEKAHISFYSQTNQLYYANNIFGTWSYTTIDTNTNAGQYNALAVDSNGYIHICYFDNNTTEFKYATNSGGFGWNTEVIMTGTFGQYRPGIAVDDSGFAHVSFNRGGDLYYATNSSGSWVPTQLHLPDEWLYFDGQTSVAIDGKGKMHITTRSAIGWNVVYATNALGAWTAMELDDQTIYNYASEGGGFHIAADSKGKVYITAGNVHYYKYSFFFTNRTGTWEVEEIPGYDVPVLLDAHERVHMAYEKDNNIYHAVESNGAAALIPIINYLLN